MDVSGDFVGRDEFNRLDKEVNGNGQPGMRQNLEKCVSQLDAMRGAQDEMARIDNRRWTIQALILTALGLAITMFGVLEVNWQHHAGYLKFPQIRHSYAPDPVLSSFQKLMAIDPTIPR